MNSSAQRFFPSPWQTVLGIVAVVLLLGISPLALARYDSPNFDRLPFDADALSLSENQRDEIVHALTAVARNFPDAPQLDDDLREKALGIALTLDPMSPDARNAHARLLRGGNPVTVPYFKSANLVAKSLWDHAQRLNHAEAEPEDRRLAPLLMEISLLVDPGEPKPRQLLTYQRACELAPFNWNRFLTLEPAENPSNARAIALFRKVQPAAEPKPEPPPKPATVAKVDPDTAPDSAAATPPAPTPPAMEPDEPPVSEVKIEKTELTYIALDRENAEVVGGVASLEIREPTEDETSLFGLFIETGTDQSFEMRLTYDRDGPTVMGIDEAETLIRGVFPRWPDRLFGEFTFRPPASQSAPASVNLGLPALLMLRSVFSGDALNEAFAPAREYAFAGNLRSRGRLIRPNGNRLVDYVKVAAAMPITPQALFVPTLDEGAETHLVNTAASGSTELLLRPQVFVFDSVETLQGLVFEEPPADLLAALENFKAIQNLYPAMDVGTIARNAVVQSRLEAILETWPDHLSARALLAYGNRPVEMGMNLEASRDAIYLAMLPIRDYFEEQVTGTSGGLVSQADELIDTADRRLSELRTEIDSGARDYLSAAEKTLEAYETYLSLNNRDSSLGQQRLRELQENLATLQRERLNLPVGTPLPSRPDGD